MPVWTQICSLQFKLFPDKMFSLTFPWFLIKSLTFPWQLSNSVTFPGFPDKWSPCLNTVYEKQTKYFPYLTISPRRTRKLLRTHRLMRIFSSETVSSDKTMQTVSLRLLPFIRTVSPRNSWSSSILFYNSQLHSSSYYKVKVSGFI